MILFGMNIPADLSCIVFFTSLESTTKLVDDLSIHANIQGTKLLVKQLRTLRYHRLPNVDDLHEAFTARKTNRNSHIYHQPHPAKAVEVAQLQIIK